MRRMQTVRKGFTLVEILIVVIILGILAAIVIPQFTNASSDARNSNMVSQLQTLRSTIELYKLEHADGYPTTDGLATSAWDWTKLTGKTNPDFAGSTTGTPTKGPYLQSPLTNPLVAAGGTTVTNVNADPAVGTAEAGGWVFSSASGKSFGLDKDGKVTAN